MYVNLHTNNICHTASLLQWISYGSLTLQDRFFPLVFVVVEKGSDDIVSIEWSSDTLAL